MITRGTIIFEDVKGKRARMTVRGVADMASLKTFAQQMSSRTRAKIVAVSYHEQENVDIGSAVEGKWDTVNNKAQIVLENTDTGLSSTYELPCPLESLFDHIEKVGYLMKKLQGDAITDDFNTVSSINFRFNKGKFDSDQSQAQI